MNQKQRKQWDSMVNEIVSPTPWDEVTINFEAIVDANAYILKLERELQNIKGHKRIAKVLMPKEGV